MKCPFCHHAFALTWREYFQEIWGRHNCIACKRRFKLSFSWPYLAITVLMAMIVGTLATFLIVRWTHSRLITAIGCLAIVLVVLLPLDRWLDDHWRKSAPLEPDKPKS